MKFQWILPALALITCPASALPLISQPSKPSTNSVSAGASLTNKVVATSASPPVSYQWRLDQHEISGATNNILKLTNMQPAHAGIYIAVVTDATGSIESASFTVDVNTLFTKIVSDPITAVVGRVTGAAVADYNNDGYSDVFMSAAYTPNVIFTNDRNGSFNRVSPNPVNSGTSPSAAGAWGDYDNDGYPDLFVSVNAQENDLLYHNEGNGVLKKITAGPVVSSGGRGNGTGWADFDCDGNLDLYVCNSDQNNFLYRNLGNGTFKRLTTNAIVTATGNSQNCAWGDYDNDGFPDLFVGKGGGNNVLYHNEKNGKFTALLTQPMSKEGSGGGGVWVDYDNDGFIDLFVANISQKPFLYHNNGDGTFAKVTNNTLVAESLVASGSAWADYDNDGFLDVFISQLGGRNLLFHNSGDGDFTKVGAGSVLGDGGEGAGPVWLDINNDGSPDLVVPNYRGNQGFLYRNNNVASNQWITINCEGRVSNRSAIGAKVRLKTIIAGKQMWQLREIGFQSDLRAQFGLGQATNIALVRIEWPSGIVQQLTNVAPGQFLTVREPSKVTARTDSVQGELKLGITGGKGRLYELQCSTNLELWVGFMIVTNSASEQTIELNQALPGPVFYRVQEQP